MATTHESNIAQLNIGYRNGITSDKHNIPNKAFLPWIAFTSNIIITCIQLVTRVSADGNNTEQIFDSFLFVFGIHNRIKCLDLRVKDFELLKYSYFPEFSGFSVR